MEADSRRLPSGKDLISDLPDDILHHILVRLSSTAAAARTSVLSSRWRHIWASMPELYLACDDKAMPVSTPDTIDAALGGCSAPTLRRIEIELCRANFDLQRLAPWLQFASQRLVGSLYLSMFDSSLSRPKESSYWGLVLPLCERATDIKISADWYRLMLRPPESGSFAALTDLNICDLHMDGRELERLVSLQCPCLRKLSVFGHLVAPCDVSITSESIKHLRYHVSDTTKLDICTSELTKISVNMAKEAYIAAPKLEKLIWRDYPYDPSRHKFLVTGRHLRRLWVNLSSTLLMSKFDSIDELRLSLFIREGATGYMNFQKNMDKLPTCQTLWLSVCGYHRITPSIFYLLERCSHIRKLKLQLVSTPPSQIMNPCRASSKCPCHLQGNNTVDNITFDSLKELEIWSFNGSVKHEELVLLLLSRCNAEILKRVDITACFYRVPASNTRVCRRIRRKCSKNTKVEFHVYAQGGRIPFYI
ncbi:hypothetical protein EJB05_51140 [Eragrostis curvula]|uniref:Uncharacterized protein n=1 Tax=Eragrostis curvula TaxID=38414 RepID=A0A5J9SWI7_9POAL|nr:hypothetical protein EJB05_51140 [Eragrostis curvula]